MKSLRDYEEKLFRAVNPAVRFSVTRYVLSIGLFVGVVLFGLLSFAGLGVDLLPSINIPVVAVVTRFPGATPRVVDQEVTQVIENDVSTITGIADINSRSSKGDSRVILSFNPGVNRNSVANEVASQVAGSIGRLPTGINPPVVRTFDPNSRPILEFGIYGGRANVANVSEYAQNILTPLLERIDGVANVQIEGGPTRQFKVLLDPAKLAYYHINPEQVVQAISNAAINQPIGSITTNRSTLTFTTQNQPSDVRQIQKIVVNSSNDVTVSDLAAVRNSEVTPTFARINGKPVVLVSIQKTSGGNSVATVAAVRHFLQQQQLPKGYQVLFSHDTTVPIKAAIHATYRELLLTAAVVAFVVLLFLGRLNTALSVILAIPIALSAAPVLYHFLGYTLNLVSLLALLVAIGIVVDDSIVVAENVERHRAMGAKRVEAVLRGASEVFSAVAAASLSLISVLLPVSFLGGFAGKYLQQFSLGLAAAVLFSWFEALLFLTVRLAYTPDSRPRTWRDFFGIVIKVPESFRWGFRTFRRPLGIVIAVVYAAAMLVMHHPIYIAFLLAYPFALSLLHYVVRVALGFLEALTVTLHGWTEAGLSWVRDRYVGSLKGVMRASPWILAGSGLFFVLTIVFIMPRVPFSFVPHSDNGSLRAFVRMPNGTSTEATNSAVGKVEQYFMSQPAVKTVQTVIGGGGVFGGGNQANNARLQIQLVPLNQRPGAFALIGRYRRAIRKIMRNHPGARAFVSAGGGFRGEGSSTTITLASPNYNLLNKENTKILALLQSNKWVGDATSSISRTTLENDFQPNPSSLKGSGISPKTLARTLRVYTTGSQAGNVEIGGQSYPIMVEVDPRYLQGEQSLLSLPVYSSAMKTNLEVGQLGGFTPIQAPRELRRYDRLYTAQYSLNLRKGAPSVLIFQHQIQRELTRAGLLGNGVTMSNGSRFGLAALTRRLSILGPEIFGLSVLLAYLVMGAQFNSFRYPIYLLLPVPLALIGAIWFVFLLGGGLDVFGVMGMLMLIGLSAKNAILYLDFVVARLGKMPFVDALIDSARLRFRPIVMTTMTVLVISFPLIFNHGQGSEFGQRLGEVMLGGILFSAILTFFVVPAAFYLFERKRAARREQESQRLSEIEAAAEAVRRQD